MLESLTILAIVQTVILVALLFVNMALLSRIRQTGERANEVLDRTQKLLDEQVLPAIGEARSALKQIEEAASGANEMMAAASPLVSTAKQLSGTFQKSSAPIWIDAMKLAVNFFMLIKSKKSKSKPDENVHTNNERELITKELKHERK